MPQAPASLARRVALAGLCPAMLWLMSGCGGAAVPAETLTAAKASVRAAEVGGAESHPKAALHLKLARDQIQQGQRLIEDGDNERAKLVLDRAEIDAEVALAIARERYARAEADKALADLARLREKLGTPK